MGVFVVVGIGLAQRVRASPLVVRKCWALLVQLYRNLNPVLIPSVFVLSMGVQFLTGGEASV